MGNPNSGKGRASKFEDLMNYQKHKKPKRKSEESVEENEYQTEIPCCKLPEITENNQEISEELDQPIMQDFIDVIDHSQILHNKDLSLQLLFLMNYFIKTKMQNNVEE